MVNSIQSFDIKITETKNDLVSAESEKNKLIAMKVSGIALIVIGVIGIAALLAVAILLPPLSISVLLGVGIPSALALIISPPLLVFSHFDLSSIKDRIQRLSSTLTGLEAKKIETEKAVKAAELADKEKAQIEQQAAKEKRAQEETKAAEMAKKVAEEQKAIEQRQAAELEAKSENARKIAEKRQHSTEKLAKKINALVQKNYQGLLALATQGKTVGEFTPTLLQSLADRTLRLDNPLVDHDGLKPHFP